ncbi:MAG: hypothetical protein ACI4SS_06410, partial [Clostridia bacterium]
VKKGKNSSILYLAAVIAVLLGVIAAVHSCSSRIEPDLTISYIGENYFDSEKFYREIPALEETIEDINGDGQKKIEIVYISFSSNLTASQEQSNLSKLTMAMGQGESRVYLMDKTYCQRYAESEILADLSDYVPDGAEVLTDSNGQVYAISVEGNPIVENLGLDDTEGVYIALRAITEMDYVNYKNPGPEEMDKTARSIIKQIIE